MPTSALTIVILLNGTPIDFGPLPKGFKPSFRDGVIMVPVRPMLEAIGAKVDTNSTSATRKNWYEVYVTYQGKEVKLLEEYSIVSKRGGQLYYPLKRKAPTVFMARGFMALPFHVTPENPTGMGLVSRYVMPLGFLATTFNFSLKWDEKRKIVEITTTK
jgi:hypothetical protein